MTSRRTPDAELSDFVFHIGHHASLLELRCEHIEYQQAGSRVCVRGDVIACRESARQQDRRYAGNLGAIVGVGGDVPRVFRLPAVRIEA